MMNSTTPVVSVIMGVRDAGAGLRKALASLVSQTFTDWECVLVDDGSSEDSGEIVREFRDSRFRVFSRAQLGLTSALKHGAVEARGVYIARLDADDEALPERFRTQVSMFEQNPALSAVGGSVELISENGAILGRHSYPIDHAKLLRELEALLTPIPHSTLMMRRSVFESVGGYRLRFAKAQDYDLLLRISERGLLGSSPELLARICVSRGSMTANPVGGEQFEFTLLAYTCMAIRRTGHGDPLENSQSDAFNELFRLWYRASRYPGIFRSRLDRRLARLFLSDGCAVKAVGALMRATMSDPYWLVRCLGIDADLASDAREWARLWVRRKG